MGSSLKYEVELVAVVAIPANGPDWPSDSGDVGLLHGLIAPGLWPADSTLDGTDASTNEGTLSPLSPLFSLTCFRILCRVGLWSPQLRFDATNEKYDHKFDTCSLSIN